MQGNENGRMIKVGVRVRVRATRTEGGGRKILACGQVSLSSAVQEDEETQLTCKWESGNYRCAKGNEDIFVNRKI